VVEIQIERSAFHSPAEVAPPRVEGSTAELGTPRPSTNGAPVRLQLSDDDSILTLFGERLIFGGAIQKSILRQLVDACRNDRRLRTAEVLRRATTGLKT
jgi:hypothetical protein